jgi:hypothetical protein
LKNDSKDGKHWVYSEDNKKCEVLLHPLGKLLLAQIPSDFPHPNNGSSGYQYIVEADELDSGSVVSCLSALAQASGSEQLWKLLNHAVLKACTEESRVECRRAGLSCLLLNMKHIGEEYMFLLPEILPILAELIEDTDEEVVNLAKEVTDIASELNETDILSRLR